MKKIIDLATNINTHDRDLGFFEDIACKVT